jgi:hypothetical protein
MLPHGLRPLSGTPGVTHIVGIGEEAGAGDGESPYMAPRKGGLINLGEREASSFVRVDDVKVVIVGIVEGGVTSARWVSKIPCLCHW